MKRSCRAQEGQGHNPKGGHPHGLLTFAAMPRIEPTNPTQLKAVSILMMSPRERFALRSVTRTATDSAGWCSAIERARSAAERADDCTPRAMVSTMECTANAESSTRGPRLVPLPSPPTPIPFSLCTRVHAAFSTTVSHQWSAVAFGVLCSTRVGTHSAAGRTLHESVSVRPLGAVR